MLSAGPESAGFAVVVASVQEVQVVGVGGAVGGTGGAGLEGGVVVQVGLAGGHRAVTGCSAGVIAGLNQPGHRGRCPVAAGGVDDLPGGRVGDQSRPGGPGL